MPHRKRAGDFLRRRARSNSSRASSTYWDSDAGSSASRSGGEPLSRASSLGHSDWSGDSKHSSSVSAVSIAPRVPPLLLGRAASTAEQLAAALDSARLQGEASPERLAAAAKRAEAAARRRRRQSQSRGRLALSPTVAAVLLAGLALVLGLYMQNAGLRAALLHASGHISQLRLAERFAAGLPALGGPDGTLGALGLANLSAAIAGYAGGLSLPELGSLGLRDLGLSLPELRSLHLPQLGLSLPELGSLSLRDLGLGLPELSSLGLRDLSLSLPQLGLSLPELGLGLPAGLSLPELSTLLAALPRPGLELREAGLRPKHPVVIIPGFVTSGLELWQALPCAAGQRRGRVWGSWAMTRSFLTNKQCWIDHLRLDEATGLDPAGVKVRASQGLEAVEYFMAGYVVWARLIDSLADLGYEPNDLVTEPYDWRLALPNLERRDGYFSRLQARIEVLVRTRGEKVCVVAHSWGDTVFRAFLAWAGARQPLWAEQHVAVLANVAGPSLGVPKALSSYLSGETRDTVEMGFLASTLANAHFSRAQRARLFRSWGGGLGMLPTGGAAIWGNASWAPDDSAHLRRHGLSYGAMLTAWEAGNEAAEAAARQHTSLLDALTRGQAPAATAQPPEVRRLDAEAGIGALVAEAGPQFAANAQRWAAGMRPDGSHDAERECAVDSVGPAWHFSPLACPLPAAPSLRLLCLYGVGVPTERAYHYQHLRSPKAAQQARREPHADRDPTELDTAWRLYADVDNPGLGVDSGVLLGDGDGTVPLLSLGGLCRRQWRARRLNPAGLPVVTREYSHEGGTLLQQIRNLPNFMRGGPRSADHVDILSHAGVLRDVLTAAAGQAHTLGDRLRSQIDAIAARLPAE